jgi:hypothetical protein
MIIFYFFLDCLFYVGRWVKINSNDDISEETVKDSGGFGGTPLIYLLLFFFFN